MKELHFRSIQNSYTPAHYSCGKIIVLLTQTQQWMDTVEKLNQDSLGIIFTCQEYCNSILNSWHWFKDSKVLLVLFLSYWTLYCLRKELTVIQPVCTKHDSTNVNQMEQYFIFDDWLRYWKDFEGTGELSNCFIHDTTW